MDVAEIPQSKNIKMSPTEWGKIRSFCLDKEEKVDEAWRWGLVLAVGSGSLWTLVGES